MGLVKIQDFPMKIKTINLNQTSTRNKWYKVVHSYPEEGILMKNIKLQDQQSEMEQSDDGRFLPRSFRNFCWDCSNGHLSNEFERV